MARSILRILTALIASISVLLAIAAIAIRQPSFAQTPYDGAARAESATLRRPVAYLTAAHIENPDAVAGYIANAFRAAGGDVREQVFHARGRTFRNVIARFGAGDGPLLVVGAHYDAFAAY